MLTNLVPYTESFLLLFLRVGAFIFLAPVLGEAQLSTRIKIGLLVSTCVFIYPILDNVPNYSHSILFEEILVGAALGIILRLFLFCLQIAGTIAAQCTSLSQILGSSYAEPMPSIGHVLVLGGLCTLCIFKWHVGVVEYIFDTYSSFPVGGGVSFQELYQTFLQTLSKTFSLSLILAMPFVFFCILYNLTIGVVSKAMPQLMVAFVGAPVITGGSILLLYFSAGAILEVWSLSAFNFLLLGSEWFD